MIHITLTTTPPREKGWYILIGPGGLMLRHLDPSQDDCDPNFGYSEDDDLLFSERLDLVFGPQNCSPQESDSKLVICEDCGKNFYATLKTKERELLDGYHGCCPNCGYWHFEIKG